jgi:hypothetical protein
MNTYFELIPQGDSPIRARSGLWSGELRRRQCKQCFAMLSQYQEQPCAVDLDWDGFPSYSLPLLDYRLPVIVMHQRIATELRPYIVGCWSELFLRGEEASDYSVLVASPSYRVTWVSQDGFRDCPECGRQLAGACHPDTLRIMPAPSENMVFYSELGDRAFISSELVKALPSQVLQAIELRARRSM